MRRSTLIVMAACLALAVTGCKKKGPAKDPSKKPADTKNGKKPDKKPDKKPAAGPNALPVDKAWASGKIKGAALELATRVEIPGMKGVKDAGGGNTETQMIWVTAGRGRIIFTTKKSYVPENTELRYNADKKKYVLTHPVKKEYWAMTGGQLGNTLEGGPELKRSAYKVEIKDTDKKAKIADIDTKLTNASIAFDWKVKTKSGEKSGKMNVKLSIWHSGDKKFDAKWGDTLMSLLAIPFQDKEGQAIVDQLNKKVGFPVKWAMEFVQEGGKKEKGESYPKLITTASKVEVKELDKAGFAWPPAGLKPAGGPYTFGDGGQTMGEDDLKKLPAKKGKKPKNVEPVK
jgi:predicted small lipoprotein YifL